MKWNNKKQMEMEREYKMDKRELREMLFQVDAMRRRVVQNFLLEIGLTPGQGQARIMQFLAEHKPVTQRELAEICMLDVTTMSRTLDRMEQAGFLERVSNPGCRRSYLIKLTKTGEEKAKEVEVGFQKLDEILCESMTEEELEALVGGLKKVKENIGACENISTEV